MKVIFEMTVGIVLTRKAGGLAKNRVRVCAQELMLAFPQHCIVSREGGSTVFSWEPTPSNPARFHSRRMILKVKSGSSEQRGRERNQSEPGENEPLGKRNADDVNEEAKVQTRETPESQSIPRCETGSRFVLII